MNIIILTKKLKLIEVIKEVVYHQLSGEIYFYTANSFSGIDDRWLSHLFFIIVDIDDCDVLSEQQKVQLKWKNIFYIYVSGSNNRIKDVIGYNVLGYFLYQDTKLLRNKIKIYQEIILSKQDCYFKTENGIQMFLYEDILYFEVKGRNVYINYRDQEIRLVNYKLYELEKMIDHRFVQVNQSVIVNTQKILCISKEHDIILESKNKQPIKISKKFRRNIDEKKDLLDKMR
mgnify:CR=1 FL=1